MIIIEKYKIEFVYGLNMIIQVSLTFQKFALQHFTFMKDLHKYLFSLTARNPKRIFTFTKKV